MNWNNITSEQQLDQIDAESKEKTIMILKHSTRCSISAASLSRIERNWKEDGPIKPYFLDILNHRQLSETIATRYSVPHESPQVLVIKDAKCVFSQSHIEINLKEISEHA